MGRIVRHCLETGERLETLSPTRLREFCPAFKPDVAKYISIEACVERRLSTGGTSSRRVAEADPVGQADRCRGHDASRSVRIRAGRHPIVVALFLIPACGRKGPPLPPRPVVPVAVGNFRAEPRETGIVLSWTRPTRNDDGSPLTDLLEFRLSRATVPLGATTALPTAFSCLAAIRADQPENAQVQGSLYAYRDDAGGHGLATGRQYRYRVRAMNRRGQAGASPRRMSAVDFTAPSVPPVGLKATAGDGTVDVGVAGAARGGTERRRVRREGTTSIAD